MPRLFDDEGNLLPEELENDFTGSEKEFEAHKDASSQAPDNPPTESEQIDDLPESLQEETEDKNESAEGETDAAAQEEQEAPKKRHRRTKAEMEAARAAEAAQGEQKDVTADSEPDDDKADAKKPSLLEAIFLIGLELRAPKSNRLVDPVTGREFPYRSVEDILSALKPLREKYGVFITFSSHPVAVGDSTYIEVEATVRNLQGETFSVSSSAKEDVSRPGSWAAQISGSCESYAKKYCLQSLFMIDDSKLEAVADPDALPCSAAVQKKSDVKVPAPAVKPLLTRGVGDWKARMRDAAEWKGTADEFRQKILSYYRVDDLNMTILLAAVPGR